jgi:HSP20 family protein
MRGSGRPGELEEIFEILVTSYAQKGGAIASDRDLCWRPATDAFETDDTFVVQMDLAGMDPSQIEVLADAESVLVRGIRKEISGGTKKHYHEMEISVGPFSRRVNFTVPVDSQSGQAQYRGGFLFVTFTRGAGKGTEHSQIVINRKG